VRLRTEASVRKAVRTGFTRPVDIPEAFVHYALEMTHQDFVGAMRGPLNYLRQRSLPGRLMTLGIPLLVIFGADDQRWRSCWLPHIKPCPAPVSSCCRAWDTPQCWKTRKRPANC
jgi:hypothetical protein